MNHLFTPILLSFLIPCAPVPGADWAPALCLDGDGLWRQRIAVTVRNGLQRDAAGDPVSIPIGAGDGALALVGQRAEAFRVVSASGRELLFRIEDSRGLRIDRGPIEGGSVLVIPAECAAGSEATCQVYFDNPAAWAVPDFLETKTGLENGGLEAGTGEEPTGWRHDSGDSAHVASWVEESPRSGRRCLKTVVAQGAETTWISTRQSGMGISPGARYRMRAWVRAEDVKGFAGWYLHVGSPEAPMLVSPILDGGGGTYGWKEVSAEFTAPAGSSIADLGTVLRGTGTAWFDDASLECLTPPQLSARAGAVETIQISEAGAAAPWPEQGAESGGPFAIRFPVRIANLSSEAAASRLVSIDVSAVLARLRNGIPRESLRLFEGASAIPCAWHGDRLLFVTDLPARTRKTLQLLVPVAGERQAAPAIRSAPELTEEALLASKANLVKNPDFEEGGDLPTEWLSGAPGERPPGTKMGFGAPGRFGKRCAEIHIPRGAATSWTGWRQDVPVRPGHTYIYSAWLKCMEIENGSAVIHAHIRNARGEICKGLGMISAGAPLSGTKDWTLLEGIFRMPEDAAVFQIHLTVQATGTLWHDGVLVAEVESARTGGLEAREDAPGRLTAWPVNPIVKVFQDDPAPAAIRPAAISAARGEKEPLVIALRAAAAIPGLKVLVEAPAGPGGQRLPVETGIVGYVPIDAPSSYYEANVPAWQRRLPSGAARSDGWPGLWPDPILPRDTLDLPARTTRPVWITVTVPETSAAGLYAGAVRWTAGGEVLREIPFTVRVRKFSLPREFHLKAIYDLRMDGRWRIAGKSAEEARRDFLRFLADHRICPDRIEPDPVLRFEGGRAVAEFSAYDRAAAFHFDELKLPHSYSPGVFYLFGWGHPPEPKFGEAPYEGAYPYAGADRRRLRPQFKKAYQACLKAWWDHVREKGWADRFTLYISDEPYYSQPRIRDQMRALCDMIHEVDAAIPIYSSTWQHVPEWNGSLDVWGVGHYGTVPVPVLNEIRRSGSRLWFTTDGHMCTDTPYCAIERLLPHYAFTHGAEAYEFWGMDWLTYDPYAFGWHSFIFQSGEPGSTTWVRYPNGDGYLAYPGGPIGHPGPVPSIRLEAAREGMEDYEYLWLLRERMGRAKAAGRSVAGAEKALAQAAGLAEIPNAGGTFSTKILPDPERILRIREAVAEAIEELE